MSLLALLLTQHAGIDTPYVFAVANRGSVVLVRREKREYAFLTATEASRGEMPRRWTKLPRVLLGMGAYRDGFVAYEEKGGLLFFKAGQPLRRLAGLMPPSMPNLAVQDVGTDVAGNPFVRVDGGGDYGAWGLATLRKGAWSVISHRDSRYMRMDDTLPAGPDFLAENDAQRVSHLWIPSGPKTRIDLARRLPKAWCATMLSTADPGLKAYFVTCEQQPKGGYLATVRRGRLKIARTDEDARILFNFVPAEDRIVGFDGRRLIVSRTRALKNRRLDGLKSGGRMRTEVRAPRVGNP